MLKAANYCFTSNKFESRYDALVVSLEQFPEKFL